MYWIIRVVQQVAGRGGTEIGEVNFRRFHLFIVFAQQIYIKTSDIYASRIKIQGNICISVEYPIALYENKYKICENRWLHSIGKLAAQADT